MTHAAAGSSVRWYQSFYFRLGFSFVIFVVSVLVAQSAIFSALLARGALPGRSPNNAVAIVAADLSSALAQNPTLDVDGFLKREYRRDSAGVCRDEERHDRLEPDAAARSRDAALGRGRAGRPGFAPRWRGARLSVPPFVMAPVQVAGDLRGMVVLPPAPSPSPLARDVGRLLSVPGYRAAGAGHGRRRGVHLRAVKTPSRVATGCEPAARGWRPVRTSGRQRQRRGRRGGGDIQQHGSRPRRPRPGAPDGRAAAQADAGRRVARAQDAADRDARVRGDAAQRGARHGPPDARALFQHARAGNLSARSDRERYLLDLARFEHAAVELDIRDFAVRRLFATSSRTPNGLVR